MAHTSSAVFIDVSVVLPKVSACACPMQGPGPLLDGDQEYLPSFVASTLALARASLRSGPQLLQLRAPRQPTRAFSARTVSRARRHLQISSESTSRPPAGLLTHSLSPRSAIRSRDRNPGHVSCP
eukprot:3898013-Rhodomonas_salina.2